MEILDLEDKEFNLKFSFGNLLSTFMYLQKILTIYPNTDDPAFKDCVKLRDSITDQLSQEDINSINRYFNAINLENTLEKDS